MMRPRPIPADFAANAHRHNRELEPLYGASYPTLNKWRRELGLAPPRQPRPKPTSKCPHGHPYTPDNLYIAPSGGRYCRQCRRINSRKPRPDRVKRPRVVSEGRTFCEQCERNVLAAEADRCRSPWCKARGDEWAQMGRVG